MMMMGGTNIILDRHCGRNSFFLRKAVHLTILTVILTAIMFSLEGMRKSGDILEQQQHYRRSERQTVHDSLPSKNSGNRTEEAQETKIAATQLVEKSLVKLTNLSSTLSSSESSSTTSITTTTASSTVPSSTASSTISTAMSSSSSTTESTTKFSSTQSTTISSSTLSTSSSISTEATIVHTDKNKTLTSTTESTSTPTSTRFFSSSSSESDVESTPSSEMMCEEPAYHEFPDDIFGNNLRAKGAVIIHILVGVYMFYALAVVCDEYFVASMEKICDKMHLSEDVAGATFMAAGSSAPELFASILGVFVAKGDVGTGTIVGSAVFNLLFVIGFCAVLCGKPLPLSWWTIWRDSVCYAVTVLILIIVMFDGVVTSFESFTMLIVYGFYIIVVKYSFKIRRFLTENTRLGFMDDECTQGILTHDDKQIRSSYVQFNNDVAEENISWKNEDPSQLDLDEIIRDYPRKMSLYEAALKMMTTRYFRPYTRFRFAAKRIIVEFRYIRREGYPNKSIVINESHYSNTKGFSREVSKETREAWKKAPTVADQGLLTVTVWFIRIPVLATLHYTIPDCRNATWERYFLATFFVAMLWIAIFSYVLIWMVTLVGYTFGIPDTIMGITFLAAGTSVPDAYTSLLVAKQGLGDMAVANSIGSNVFDILVGLALPWFFRSAIYDSGIPVPINSRGLVYNVLLLFLSIVVTVLLIHSSHWLLTKRLGYILLASYVVFLFFSILIEFNVFGFVNLPECDE